ncbi:hypothetical protein LEP1GSC188_1917 [Leptospira weilii serovar Topaz str. LT2116]|uniref:Uncharacterized protein n=1 Tax=Leptospira weilii serovar Topaz str. LT2116 TaxID=1088540 RepID=M3H3R2_9LEPT|nr:hypothetical protein LEP1GSC188_1917 [Leptospira weilii serovar Topaz str. LT2116]
MGQSKFHFRNNLQSLFRFSRELILNGFDELSYDKKSLDTEFYVSLV